MGTLTLTLEMSHTRIVRSSLLDTMSSCLGWKSTQDTLLVWPRIVSTSHAWLRAVDGGERGRGVSHGG